MAIKVKSGTWGISQIVSDRGGWSCAAMVNNPATVIEAHYPPLNKLTGQYTHTYCIVCCPNGLPNTNGTFLVPRRIDIDGATIGTLNNPQRTALRNAINAQCTAYSYTDWDGQIVNKPAIDAAAWPNTMLLTDVILALYSYLGHSEYRPRPLVVESHNTEYTDDFTSGVGNWTGFMGGTPTHDATDLEMDCNTDNSDSGVEYTANNPGSIEQEAQITFFNDGRATKDVFGVAVRIDSSASDGYFIQPSRQLACHYVSRYNGAVRTSVATLGSLTLSADIFMTVRGAVSGGIGSNAVISLWMSNHGASKPSDPGWYGTDGSPDQSTTDSSADRLDASTHIGCGVGWQGAGADWDPRCDFFKERAISDRSGGSTTAASSSGAGTATGSGSSIASVPANSAGASTATGRGAAIATANASSVGTSTATAGGSALASVPANSVGISVATAVGASETAAEGAGDAYSAGASTAVAGGASVNDASAASDGDSTAQAATNGDDVDTTRRSHSSRMRRVLLRKKRVKIKEFNRKERDESDLSVIMAAMRDYYRAAYSTGFPVDQ